MLFSVVFLLLVTCYHYHIATPRTYAVVIGLGMVYYFYYAPVVFTIHTRSASAATAISTIIIILWRLRPAAGGECDGTAGPVSR